MSNHIYQFNVKKNSLNFFKQHIPFSIYCFDTCHRVGIKPVGTCLKSYPLRFWGGPGQSWSVYRKEDWFSRSWK